MRHRSRPDKLNALLIEIEAFDRHESVPRVLVAIDASFDACETFVDQERLVGTLVSMARSHYFAFAKVLEHLWSQATKWEALQRGRTLSAIAWYLAPSITKWTYPLPRELVQADLGRQASSEIQTFLVSKQGEIWRLASSRDANVAIGAIMVIGTIQSLDGGDLELLLDAAAQSGEPVVLATALLSVGRAGQYSRESYGNEAVLPLAGAIGALVAHSDVWVSTLAVAALALLALPLPASAPEVLLAAIRVKAPIPELWLPAGAFWKNDTSLQNACTILSFAKIAPSEQLIAALEQVPEGRDRRDALMALEHLTSASLPKND